MDNWCVMYTTSDGFEDCFETMASNRVMAYDLFDEFVKENSLVVTDAVCVKGDKL